jgi:hypothetical protein
MKRVITLIVISLFLISCVYAGITASAIDNDSSQNNELNKTQPKLTNTQIQNIIRARNRIRTYYTNQSECPNNCTCTGSATKCRLANSEREMTITAGNSGNIIIQVKGINASTRVELYKLENKVYGIFKNNETREIILPDQIRERLMEHLQERLQNQTIELAEEGYYKIKAEKKAKLFAIFPIKTKVQAEVDVETGEILRVRRPWWNFLAKDIEEESEEQ